jgi:hypothetical protein
VGKTRRAYWRTPAYNFLRIIITLFCALVYGTMYYRRGAVRGVGGVGRGEGGGTERGEGREGRRQVDGWEGGLAVPCAAGGGR